jgi:hypothetical protein
MIKIMKKRADLIGDIINKGFIGVVSNFILETKIPNKENNKIRVIRTACMVFSELAEL